MECIMSSNIKYMNEINSNIVCYDTGEVFTSYKEYLYSKHWRNLKLSFLKKRPLKCKVCGINLSFKDQFDFHHLTYERIGKERLKDIAIVCRNKCHLEAHTPHFKSKIEDERNMRLLSSQKNIKPSCSELQQIKISKEKQMRDFILKINKLVKLKDLKYQNEIDLLKKELYKIY